MNDDASRASASSSSAAAAAASTASSHLVASKHDAKCRRVPRIISRRQYCYRRKSASKRPTTEFGSSPRNWRRRHRDFSPGFVDLPRLEETVLRLLVKYPERRSYSADSDPLILFRCEMNKSSFFNHSLMKRRYSVPETVMRKYKLQETQSRKRNSDQSPEPAVQTAPQHFKDESCQTEQSDIFLGYASKPNGLHKKSGKGKRRESVRCFRKANSYCQYKSLSMFHKRMMGRTRDAHSLSSLENLQSDGVNFGEQSSTAAEVEALRKCSSDNTVVKRSNPVRQLSDPPCVTLSASFCGTESPGRSHGGKLNPAAELLPQCRRREQFDSRKVLMNSKSIDQSTSGYNTVSESLDDTPRRKTPESAKASAKEGDTTGDLFPITFHSESVFLHPYQKGFLSHKELHHISIQVVPDTKLENRDDYYKTEIKVNINDGKDATTRQTARDAQLETEEDKLNNSNAEEFSGGEVIVVRPETADKTGDSPKTDEMECSRETVLTVEQPKPLTPRVEETKQGTIDEETSSTRILTREDALPEATPAAEQETETTAEPARQSNKTESGPNEDGEDVQSKGVEAADTRQSLQSTNADTSELVTHTNREPSDLAESDGAAGIIGCAPHSTKPSIIQQSATNDNLYPARTSQILISAVAADTDIESTSSNVLEVIQRPMVTANTEVTNEPRVASSKHRVSMNPDSVTTAGSGPVAQVVYTTPTTQVWDTAANEVANSAPATRADDMPPRKRIDNPPVTQVTDKTSEEVATFKPVSQVKLTTPREIVDCLSTRGETVESVPVIQVVDATPRETNSAQIKPTLDKEATPFHAAQITSELPTNSSRTDNDPFLKFEPSSSHYYLTSRQDSNDCSVPTTSNSVKSDEPSRLKIEVDVGNVDFSTSLQDLLLGRKLEHKVDKHHQPDPRTKDPPAKRADKYNSKTALNYLFQKLGDSYPKRYLLKQPAFHDYSQYGRYYSDLPKISTCELPPQVLYNNQAYAILSGNLLPNERSNLRHVPPVPELADIHTLSDNTEHSDSDISIPDSLEDFQQTKHSPNKYQKYDQRLTRGGVVEVKPPTRAGKKDGIAYFIPLVDDEIAAASEIPPELKEKLSKRSNSISKHSSCIGVPKKSSSRAGKQIHKQIQTCLNVEDSLKKRRKKMATKALLNQRQKSEPELDERIADILLTGLRLQDAAEHADQDDPGPDRSVSQSAQTEDVHSQPVVSEYVELYKVQTTTTDDFKPEPGEFFGASTPAESGNVYEVVLSEEETRRVNSTNYYRSFKKSKRIYYPTKDRRPDRNEDASARANHAPTFSKYQRRLKEFKQQTRRQIADKASTSEGNGGGGAEAPTNGVDTGTLVPVPRPHTKKTYQKTFKVKNHTSKTPGSRNHRFHQRFEAIPEELSNGSAEQPDPNANTLEQRPAPVDENSNATDDIGCGDQRDPVSDTTETTEMEAGTQPEAEDQYLDKLKSQKGRDSLSGANEHEELITLSRGWINFYLLKGNSLEENGATEELEDDHVTSETFCIPQQYTVHVHATPEISLSPKSTSTFPGLCKSQKRDCKSDKTKQTDKTSLPDIGTAPNSNHSQYSSYNGAKANQKQNSLPKLHPSGEESGNGNIRRKDEDSRAESSAEPVKIDTATDEPSPSTYSNRSSPADDIRGNKNRTKKVQRYQRPHTYHSTRNSSQQWSLTVEGNHNTSEKRLASELEMQLFVKNDHEGALNNHSWKLTVRGEAGDADSTHMDRNSHASCLPHLNVNYKMLPHAYPDDIGASYSDDFSRSNSVSSCNEQKYPNKNLLSHSMKRVNGDLKLQIAKSDDDLTVRGLAITPERKPRVSTMSERDLTRMKLIKLSSDKL